MTIFTSRDYLPSAAAYVGARTYVPQMYQLPIFLNRVLGYSIVGQTGWAINAPVQTLSITNVTNASPIRITTSVPHNLVNGQSVIIAGVTGTTNANGTWVANIDGYSPTTTFTLNSANGNAAYVSGGTVTTGFLYAEGLVIDGYGAGINFGAGVEKEISIPIFKRKVIAADVGKMIVLKSNLFPLKNSGCFKVSAINQGNNTTIALASSGTTTIAVASNGASLPQATINVAATANFPASGSIFVTTSAGIQTVTYTGKTATTFTGCSGGTGTMSTGGTVTNTIATLPQGTINVASTAGFPTSGSIFITLVSNGTTQTITYTGTTGTTFTGCTGGTGIMTVGDVVANLNRYALDYRSTENPPVEAVNTINWWLYETESSASVTAVDDYVTNYAYNNALGVSGAGQNTTIAAGSNGVSLPTATINVSSTNAGAASDAFPASGTVMVVTSAGTQTVTYTGVTATSFTGCSGGTGTMSTGGAVWGPQSPIKVFTSTHGYSTGQKVTISGVIGNTAANGTYIITVANTPSVNGCFSLNGTTSNGPYIAGSPISYIEGYQGDDVSYNSRILLQSPHSTAWQVRIASEPTNINQPAFTVTTGNGGNVFGDFTTGIGSTHIAQFFDINGARNTAYANFTTGGGNLGTTSRTTIIGDDTGQTLCMYTRSVGGTANGIMLLGIPNNEPIPTPPNVERFFSYASAGNVAGTQDFGTIVLKVGSTFNIGFSMKRGIPSMTLLTGWANLDGTSATSPLLSANAGDSPFITATEVLPIEIWAGCNCDIGLAGSTNPPFFYDQVYMGTAPLLRNGRTNFGAFTLTTEEVTSRAISAATNASPIQITAAANALVTGQTVTISGVLGNTAANGTWVVTVLNSTTFTLNGSTGNGTYTSGGTANGCPRWLHLQNGLYLQWNGNSGLNP